MKKEKYQIKYKKLPLKKVEIFKSILNRPFNLVKKYPWFRIHPCNPVEVLYDSPALLNKTVATSITASGADVIGAPIYSLDVIREGDENVKLKIDRHLLNISGNTILEQKRICKEFDEHYIDEIPYYYESVI